MNSIFVAVGVFLFALPALASGDLGLNSVVRSACERMHGAPFEPRMCQMVAVDRRQLFENIYEYSLTLQVGSGANDQIGLHRVVKVDANLNPIPAAKAIFALHGSIWGFDKVFVASAGSAAVPSDQSFAIFLAKSGVDVWGMDMRSISVPASTTDFSFMSDWGYATGMQDLAVALTTARVVRLATGSGFDKMYLMGWSLGGSLGYAYLSAETQFHFLLRNVKGFIPVDTAIKFGPADETSRLAACNRASGEQAALSAGVYSSNTGQLAQTAGYLAAADPSGASPLVPGLTNLQAEHLLGAATFVLFNGNPPVPNYHFVAGTFDSLGLPTGLQFTQDAFFNEIALGATPFESMKELLEFDQLLCNQTDLPFDDHLAQVSVPTFYVGAGGAFGQHGVYSTSLLGNSDVSSQVVSFYPAGYEVVDFGHLDLFSASNAQATVWTPILNWVQAH